MAKDAVIVIRGKLHWAKVMGKARPHTGLPKYDKGPYWSVDVTPNAEGRALLKKYGCEEKLKEPKKGPKEDRTESFIALRVLENRTDGEKNKPPRIKDARGNPWPEDKLLGNETVADVKVKIVDYGKASEKGVYLQAIRILDHVPYDDEDFEPLDEDDEFFAAAEPGDEEEVTAELIDEDEDDDLDDDVPF